MLGFLFMPHFDAYADAYGSATTRDFIPIQEAGLPSFATEKVTDGIDVWQATSVLNGDYPCKRKKTGQPARGRK